MKITTLITYLLNGIVMGIAEIVPGVSASTATLLLGIYDEFLSLLDDVTNFLREILRFILRKSNKIQVINAFKSIHFDFGFFLFIGMVIGIILFSNIVTYLYDNHVDIVRAIFFGIILASIIIPVKIIKKPKVLDFIFFIIGFLSFFIVLKSGQIGDPNSIPLWLVFLGGVISVSGMVLPGVNSSFLLIPLGIYELILNIVSEFSRLKFASELIIQALTFALGLGLGLILFVKVLKFAFKSHVTKLFSLIAGIMMASLINLWPFHSGMESNTKTFMIILLVSISIILTSVFILKSKPEKDLKIG